MFKMKKKGTIKSQEAVIASRETVEPTALPDGVLLPDLSTETYVHTAVALYRKKRHVQTILEQAESLIRNETKLGGRW